MKKYLLIALSMVLVAALSVAGTLAYLQFQTPTAVNVMTLGNVKIEQLEYERVVENGDYVNIDTSNVDPNYGYTTTWKLQPFTQAKPALPAVYGNGTGIYGWDENHQIYNQVGAPGSNALFSGVGNVVDKFVFVKNTGKTDAYYRTVIAIEWPEIDNANIDENELIHINVTGNDRFEKLYDTNHDNGGFFVGYTTIDNVRYGLFNISYKNVLAPNEVSRPSLLQVFIDPKATNEDCAKFGDTWEILVVSQAIQAAGFDNAATALEAGFGKITTAQHPWSNTAPAIPAVVDTADELADAIAEGKDVILTKDVVIDKTINVAKDDDITINLNGNDLNYAVSNTGASAIISNKGNLEITGNGTLSFVAANPDMQAIPSYATNTITNTGNGTLIIGKGVVITNGSDGGASYAVDVQSGKVILDGGTLIGERCALRVARFNADAEFIMNDGLVKAATPAWIHLPGSNAADAPSIKVTINGGTFQSTKPTSEDNDAIYTYSFGNSHANTNITINGGEFLGGTVSIGSGYKGDAPTLNINGGTFEYDVLQWLADDNVKVLYKANK